MAACEYSEKVMKKALNKNKVSGLENKAIVFLNQFVLGKIYVEAGTIARLRSCFPVSQHPKKGFVRYNICIEFPLFNLDIEVKATFPKTVYMEIDVFEKDGRIVIVDNGKNFLEEISVLENNHRISSKLFEYKKDIDTYRRKSSAYEANITTTGLITILIGVVTVIVMPVLGAIGALKWIIAIGAAVAGRAGIVTGVIMSILTEYSKTKDGRSLLQKTEKLFFELKEQEAILNKEILAGNYQNIQ